MSNQKENSKTLQLKILQIVTRGLNHDKKVKKGAKREIPGKHTQLLSFQLNELISGLNFKSDILDCLCFFGFLVVVFFGSISLNPQGTNQK